MKKLERLSMVAAMLLFSAMMTFAQQKPNIHILATVEQLPEQERLLLPQIILPDK